MPSNAAVVAIVLSALPLAGCGAGKQRISTNEQSYRACGARGDPTACLRFLDRTVDVTSIQLTANVPRQVTATCAQTARLTQLPVTCPPLVPAGGVVNAHELYGPQLTADLYVNSSWRDRPPGDNRRIDAEPAVKGGDEEDDNNDDEEMDPESGASRRISAQPIVPALASER